MCNTIKQIFKQNTILINKKIVVKGWVKHKRTNKLKTFVIINDGSTRKNLQIILEKEDKSINLGVYLKLKGRIVLSKGKKQNIELLANNIKIYGIFKYKDLQKTILQPKKHSYKKLREQSYLRFRTNFFSSIMRIRHNVSYLIHKYFHKNGFYYIHTPIITNYDTEGSSNLFKVTNLNLKTNDFNSDFFGENAYLTVSGQMHAEAAALGLRKIYTFGPTFRAEKSKTPRHLAEFWMVEPEIAFFNLKNNMFLAEEFIKYIIKNIMILSKDDIELLDKKNIIVNNLNKILTKEFKRIHYSKVIRILIQNGYDMKWGQDLNYEHEKFLVESYFKYPIIIFNYPIDIKPFYMRKNKDKQTVAAMDIIFPNVGEIIGGSQREERYEILLSQMKYFKLNRTILEWYINTRRFSTVPHSGFGLGFDRLIQFITNMKNIKEVIPFPRSINKIYT
ncbi:asparagine--tRNA ligase [Candidatus Karelsulcia muelleri]|uniref:asparagine--tRNA ligase n=1 Tax=Candidatus Karelsulcia muelleri TaxID=336810 RepID=UPI0023633297|nr:asparagine--tRNA ligase [Candidatus Karelsulcia muelleri]WDE42162.1 asparagine--tRNA ligase [Candidatus Karelsulcia muelleri]WDR79151.1 asparagine--tRNA ligase [Candidatus Karelsulcia muelleri]